MPHYGAWTEPAVPSFPTEGSHFCTGHPQACAQNGRGDLPMTASIGAANARPPDTCRGRRRSGSLSAGVAGGGGLDLVELADADGLGLLGLAGLADVGGLHVFTSLWLLVVTGCAGTRRPGCRGGATTPSARGLGSRRPRRWPPDRPPLAAEMMSSRARRTRGRAGRSARAPL